MCTSRKNKFKIYYDGECTVCRTYANTMSKFDKDQLFLDINTTPSEQIHKEKLLYEIHLVDKNGKIRTGADAIFTSLARINPIFKIFSFLVRLPILNSLANTIYHFIAKRRLLWLGGNDARLYCLFIVVNLGFLFSLILSYKAWGTDRSYPLIPIISGLDWLNPLTLWLFSGLIISLAVSLFQFKNYYRFTISSLIFLIPLILLDISRLQPWVFHYSALLFLISWSKTLSNLRIEEILDAARLVVIGIYFWSGVQKMNTAFILETFPWFTESLWSSYGDVGAIVALTAAIFIPFIESLLAIGLLTHRFRTISIIGSTAMLLLVISTIITGHSWNSVVWPWNFAIFSMVLILFLRYDSTLGDFLNRIRIKRNILALLATAVFIIMPIGNYFGLVDHYLSWSLYSGRVPTAELKASKDTINDLAPTAELDNREKLPFPTWTITTMNLVPYPQERVFLNIFHKLCKKYQDPEISMVITTRPFFESHKRLETNYACSSEKTFKTE
ncbi:MAG: DUF393 domain-containing protein [Candidatus Paceibacterota bacterium]